MKLGGRYLLTAKISHGSLADFWRCEDEVLGRPVAAKMLRPHLATDPTIKRLFRREAVAAARLTHSNIVSVFDTGEHDGAPFIVMEYLGGGSLRDRLASGPLAPETVAQIGADICAALAHAHKMGIVHGDIRPENVLFSEAGHLKVSDFAIAKAAKVNPRLTDPEGTHTSHTYAAPELASGAEPDARSDLFSLGVILYECLVGMTPAVAARAAAPPAEGERARTPSPKDLRPEIPEDLDLAIIGTLQKNPSARFQSARALERTLRPLAPRAPAASAATTAASDPPTPTATAPRGKAARRSESGRDTSRSKPMPAPVAHQHPAPRPQAPEELNSPARRSSGDSFLRTEGRWLLPTIILIAAAAALVFAIPSLRTGIGNVVAPLQPDQQPRPLQVTRAQAYDPPPGDGQETNQRLPQAVDGDAATSWATSSYSRANLGGLKEGVGIFIDLGSARELSGLKVTSVAGGWQGSVRVSDDGRRWSEPGTAETASADHTFEVSGSHRYWMIWITNLVKTPGEGNSENPFAVAIREIVPLGAE